MTTECHFFLSVLLHPEGGKTKVSAKLGKNMHRGTSLRTVLAKQGMQS